MIHLASNGSRKRAVLKSQFSGDGWDEEKKRFGQCNRIVSRNHPTPRKPRQGFITVRTAPVSRTRSA